MHYNVPQYIEIEDKLAFQLTLKQLVWLGIGGAILAILYKSMSFAGFVILGIPVLGISVAFAFYRPAGMTLFTFLMQGTGYLFKPKVLTWHRVAKKRETGGHRVVSDKNKKASINRFMKEKSLKKSQSLADLLDKNSKI